MAPQLAPLVPDEAPRGLLLFAAACLGIAPTLAASALRYDPAGRSMAGVAAAALLGDGGAGAGSQWRVALSEAALECAARAVAACGDAGERDTGGTRAVQGRYTGGTRAVQGRYKRCAGRGARREREPAETTLRQRLSASGLRCRRMIMMMMRALWHYGIMMI